MKYIVLASGVFIYLYKMQTFFLLLFEIVKVYLKLHFSSPQTLGTFTEKTSN